MYLLGFDIGSSSIKVALVDANTNKTIGVAQSPDREMQMDAPHPGWAEQDPEIWWKHACLATRKLLQDRAIPKNAIGAIGIAYQMHGLVLVDEDLDVLRPSIIWCDSRAVDIGRSAFQSLGKERCLQHLLNSPGNFTASKLKWVKDNEAQTYKKVRYMLLNGDYIALKLTGEPLTTVSGLSEAVLWDFAEEDVATMVLDHYGLERTFVPEVKSTFSRQGTVTKAAAKELGVAEGIPVTYRAGDQPNNALALNVLEPGEVAATGGTSGVVYGVVDQPAFDPASRVNGFAHVNHAETAKRIGILLCINGTGILHSWIKKHVGNNQYSYPEMESLANEIPIGADGLSILPFGNGAERMLENRNLGAHFAGIHLNRHGQAHLMRAALEGIAFSFVYGLEIFREMGIRVEVMRVGNDNLFQSKIFAQTIATLMHNRIEVIETTGAVGAAKAAGYGAGIFSTLKEAVAGNKVLFDYTPDQALNEYQAAYGNWKKTLENTLKVS